MKVLSPELNIKAFWNSLKRAKCRIILLDYDGTLAPFKAQRDEATPYPGIRERLEDIIAAKGSRLVIVSGRSIEDIKPLLGLKILPEIWGSHGRERLRGNGRYESVPLSPHEKKAMEEAYIKALKEGQEIMDKAFYNQLEKKPGCLACHIRGLEQGISEEIISSVKKAWSDLAASHPFLQIHGFDGGIELRVKGLDKGQAVDVILSESPLGAACTYLGDDLTDEDAFRSIRGRGMGVLVRPELRETLADIWITPPDELLEFLQDWHNACRI